MQTFRNVINDVLDTLKETYDDSRFWTISEIERAINDAYIFLADKYFCFKFNEIIEIQAGKRVYKLNSSYVLGSLYRVEFNEKRIYPVSSEELDAMNKSWRSTEASEITNYIPPGDICNFDEIAVYPKPDTAGAVYNSVGGERDLGVITTVGDDTYEEFTQEAGAVVATSDGDAQFKGSEGGVVVDIQDPTNNLMVFAAKYPKRLKNDNETFLHPVTDNPRRVLSHGALAYLLSKDGEGKDIAKASYHNKRFNEAADGVLNKPRSKRTHRMRSITEVSVGHYDSISRVNLGPNYPNYSR
jgi:hypothetical protein